MASKTAPLQTFKTKGHTVSYRHIGSGKRKLLFFHGFPGSSIQLEIFRDYLDSHDLQAVCIDRPGYGKTTFDKRDQLELTVEFSFALTQKLEWKKFEVFAISGGTPTGLNFARQYPKHVSKITVACGLAPLSYPEFRRILGPRSVLGLRMTRFIPGKLAANIATSGYGENPPKIFYFFFPHSKADYAIVKDPAVAETLTISRVEAFAQNGIGPKRDAEVFFADWGWPLSEISHPIQFWHGEEDLLVPPAMSTEMGRHIPHAEINLIPKEGHLSLPIGRIADILGSPKTY